MAMSQPALKSAIQSALLANIPTTTSTPVTPSADQLTAIGNTADALATAIISCIQTLTITYSAGLLAPSSGGPVTGSVITCVIS